MVLLLIIVFLENGLLVNRARHDATPYIGPSCRAAFLFTRFLIRGAVAPERADHQDLANAETKGSAKKAADMGALPIELLPSNGLNARLRLSGLVG